LNDSLLSKFIDENYTILLKYLRRRFKDLNEYDAEDIIHQTLLKLLSKGSNVINVKNISAYIYQAIQNNAIDHFRKNSRIQLMDDEFISQSKSIEDQLLLHELDQIIKASIESLDEKSRYVFIETEIKGRSYEELANETGEKIGTLLSRKSRAKKKLRKLLSNYMEVE